MSGDVQPERRAGELTFRELLRWTWRQLTSMRTALILLLLLALAAVPGSVIPQENIDSLKTNNWQDAHPKLTPIYEKLGLFSVYDSPWFSAIYILLMISLVGCIVPRLFVYARALRAEPPATPRNLSRLPDHLTWTTSATRDDVLAGAERVLGRRRYRVRLDGDAVRAERGYLREAGNLLFHLSVLIVLVGFAMGSLFGYRGGVIVLVGGGFSNNLTQYDDFAPGSLFSAEDLDYFSFTVDDFDTEWLYDGPRAGMARNFASKLSYVDSPGAEPKSYELKVNHPLKVGGTEVFLVGHGYALDFTVRDSAGNEIDTGPVVFLPVDSATFRSYGVVKVPDAATPIGLEGEFYPTYDFTPETGPYSTFGEALNPRISMLAYTGDMGLDSGIAQSVYELRKDNMTLLKKKDGSMFRVDLGVGETVQLPDGAGSITLNSVQQWNRVQISKTPGTWLALLGVCLALLGLLGSLFIRPRRVWLRVREDDEGRVVELAGLDRSGGGDVGAELDAIRTAVDSVVEETR